MNDNSLFGSKPVVLPIPDFPLIGDKIIFPQIEIPPIVLPNPGLADKQPYRLTAERAVEMSREAALNEAFEAIETACKRGHYKTGFMNLCDYVSDKLRELGFTLVSAGLNYPGNYQIRWEVKK